MPIEVEKRESCTRQWQCNSGHYGQQYETFFEHKAKPKRETTKLHMEAHTCTLSTWKAEAFFITTSRGQHGLHNELQVAGLGYRLRSFSREEVRERERKEDT